MCTRKRNSENRKMAVKVEYGPNRQFVMITCPADDRTARS